MPLMFVDLGGSFEVAFEVALDGWSCATLRIKGTTGPNLYLTRDFVERLLKQFPEQTRSPENETSQCDVVSELRALHVSIGNRLIPEVERICERGAQEIERLRFQPIK